MDKQAVGLPSEIVLCYFLDGFLIAYCIIVTAFFFKQKFSKVPAVTTEEPEDLDRIYEELEGPRDADPYEVLYPSNREKKGGKKKKKKRSQSQSEERISDPYESLTTSHPTPTPTPTPSSSHQ